MSGEWTEPGCHPVADGVHRVPLTLPQDGLRAVNVYVLETDAGLALIDGGWHRPHTHTELAAGLARIGRRPAEIHDVFVTHIHRDHYTFALELRRRYGTRVHLGADEAPGLAAVRALGSNVPESSLRELRRAGAPELAAAAYAATAAEPFDRADWAAPDHWLRPGPLPLAGHDLRVLATPGHTKGHLVFHDRRRGLLYTGDHLLPTITPSIGFELGEWDLPLGRFLDSLRACADATAIMLPAHGPTGGSAGARAADLLAHHEHRFTEIAAVLADLGPATGFAVARGLTWTRRGRRFTELDTFNRMIAVCETMAHLDVLVARGVVRREPRDGVELFRPVQAQVHPPSTYSSAPVR
ncbi:MBL fold metallo-hydrolase [Nocardia farcinica]|uniref:MBL fold metallo-hydrolase n=1 Tax=Nocardia farcinica TaxID=37329 RepID=UPI000A3911D0|nr:MBL fold metallo-hydrolase [Nocardia farcinica]MBA4858287.1 MBL fold metallo-hydrolase [Nocardia farcinica]MBC9818056.1 MBL fold metallo-hydrolase [Nocardia farcinica]